MSRSKRLPPVQSGKNCPEENIIAGYIDGMLSETKRKKFEKHLLTCKHCTYLVAEVRQMNKEDTSFKLPSLKSLPARISFDLSDRIGKVISPLEVTQVAYPVLRGKVGENNAHNIRIPGMRLGCNLVMKKIEGKKVIVTTQGSQNILLSERGKSEKAGRIVLKPGFHTLKIESKGKSVYVALNIS